MATAIKASSAPATGIRSCVTCLAIYRQDFARCPLDGGNLVVGPNDPWIGSTIGGHYVIDGFVGEGAMGRVYRAHRADVPERRYAIKVLIGDLAATAQMRARFQLEAEHASKLAHPNVVGVIDYGATEHGVNYIVMDLVEGPSLGQIVMRGPMDPARVIKLAQQLCLGLEHAHGRGMIHRDFKPDNILLVGEGELEVARIADFGLALSMHDEVRLTTTGIVCTPAYAAPEQLRGQPIDHRVDLYALGTTMYEMLSGGILPFNYDDVDTSVRTKLAGDAPNIMTVAPGVPPALVSIVGRLLSSEPARRPRTARAVLRALEGALAAPRAPMQTEETARLRVRPSAAAIAVDPGDSNALPNKAASKSPSEAPVTAPFARPRRPLRRIAAQLFACGITLGGALAWFDLRGPGSVDDAVERAQPTLAAMSEAVTPSISVPGLSAPDAAIVSAQPFEPAMPAASMDTATATQIDTTTHETTYKTIEREPRDRVQQVVEVEQLVEAAERAEAVDAKPPAKVGRRAAAKTRSTRSSRRSARVVAPAVPDDDTASELLDEDFTDGAAELDAGTIARRYGSIGRQLRRLDQRLGRENTDDLWTAYNGIQITDALVNETTRIDAASALASIAEAIIDRSQIPASP